MNQFLDVFFEETAEHLATLEHLLLTLDLQAPDREALDGIFRAAHSIKGSSGMFGFDDLIAVTHELETLLDHLRRGRLRLRPDMIDLFLETGDVLAQLVEAHRQNRSDARIPVAATVEHLRRLIREERLDESAETVAAQAAVAAVEDAFGFFDAELPVADAGAADGTWGLFADEAPAGAAATDEDDAFGFFDAAPGHPEAPAAETPPVEAPAREDGRQAFGLFVDAPGSPDASASYGFFSGSPGVPSARTQSAAPAPAPARPVREPVGGDTESTSIRVSVEKIDGLINQVGELVITQAMLTELTNALDPAQYERIHQALSQLAYNTRELQESVMSIRMLPISFIFKRFPRVVHDTASRLGKQVELILQGEHTELDKSVIEKLSDPLTHIIRNSIDHGIESPSERRAAGKPEQGTVHLAAYHQGGRIVVEIRDDGRGLARERILAKARQHGLPVSDDMPDQDVWQLIFMPGFSTAEVVTDLSGRGVGMDVVRRNITSIGGRIDIDSQPGQGTCIYIRLPLTLAILDGMIVEVRDVHYVVPLTYIVESLQPRAADLHGINGMSSTVIQVRGEYLPLLSLHALLRLDGPPPVPTEAIVLILEAEGRKFALLVDRLIGQQQVVIKSLERNFRRVDGITGATIMGDGRVALILDVEALPRLAIPGEPA